MNKIKILHSADMHLGSAFSSLSYEKAKLRQNEALQSCVNLIKQAADCDALLLSGDIFDSGNVSLSIIDMFLDAVKSLSKTRVFYSCGNHDSYHTTAVSHCLKNAPSNLFIFQPDTPSVITLENLKTKIYGVSFSGEHCYEALAEKLPQCNPDYINILCMHADVGSDSYNPLNVKTLSQKGFDYAALGHIHFFDGIKKTDNCFYAYPGIPEGRGFDECGKKGFIKGTVSKNNSSLEFFPCSKREYIDEKIDISDFNNQYEIIEVLNSIAQKGNNICRFTLVGESRLGNIDSDFIASGVNSYHAICHDKTKAFVSLDSYIGYAGLLGLCARETKKLCDSSDSNEEKEKYKKAFKILSDLFENR